MFEVEILPLVPNLSLPKVAPARTRDKVPAGYGSQEQCLPFAVAASLGFLIPSPFDFGFCLADETPPGAHPFRSPLEGARSDGTYGRNRTFYVKDDPGIFAGNAFEIELAGSPTIRWYEPGISFFDRPDQMDLFKVHLPYIWRTPPDIELLLLPPVNRDAGLSPYFAVVETHWYANPVNLVFRKPPGTVHIAKGDAIAQAVFTPRDCRRPALKVITPETRAAEQMMHSMRQWQKHKSADRSAYKRLSKTPERDASPEAQRLEHQL